MSEVKVNKISPRSGTTVTLGDSGDTITLASGVSLTGVNATFSGDLTIDTDTLHVNSSSNYVQIGDGSARVSFLSNSNDSLQIKNGIIFESGSSATNNEILTYRSNSLILGTGASEAMRIDSSGNVLVGKTTTDFGTAGSKFQSNGQVALTASANEPLVLNRLSSNGYAQIIYQGGTQIGALITQPSTTMSIDGGNSSTQRSGIKFLENEIRPRKGINDSDNVVDLGNGSNRWNDLYLGGNIYLGGTGSANALDDYEEGTWTPTLQTNGTDFSSVGYANRIGSYTKIGRLVVAPFYVQLNALTVGSPSGNIVITGLPFTSLSNSANKASIIAYISNLNYGLPGFSASNDSINVGANVIHNTTTYQLTRTRNNNTADGVPYGALTSSSFAIVGTAIYDTN
jgi:hypothetical protein